MGCLKQKKTIGAHIAPARALAPTGKCQRVIFSFIVGTQFQFHTDRSCGDWPPIRYLFHFKKLSSNLHKGALIQVKANFEERTSVELELYVIRQNIEHYRAMLKITSDLAQRRVIERLLLDEEAKLKKYEEDHKKE